MEDYVLLAAGLAVMAVGDLNLTSFGRRSWLHLDEEQRAIFGTDEDMLQPQDITVSLQIWSPLIGILVSYYLFEWTVETVIESNIPDRIVALSYTAAFMILFYAPSAFLHRAGVEYATRYAAVRRSQSSNEDSRRQDESLWRWVIAAGFLMTGVSLVSIVGLPRLAGIPCGLIQLKVRLDRRKRHLERSWQARRADAALRSRRKELSQRCTPGAVSQGVAQKADRL